MLKSRATSMQCGRRIVSGLPEMGAVAVASYGTEFPRNSGRDNMPKPYDEIQPRHALQQGNANGDHADSPGQRQWSEPPRERE